MDQIKTALAQLKRYHFWVLCGVIAVVGLGSWYMTQASLHTEFEANKGEIDGVYSTVGTLLSQTNPPNPNVHQGMDLRIRDLQQYVMAVWQTQYEHQKTTILAWPNELTKKFKGAVEPLRPIEAKFNEYPTPGDKEILPDLRREYANYIEVELPKLAEVIGARWTAVAPVSDAYGDGGSAMYGSDSTSYGGSDAGSYGAAYGASSYGPSAYGQGPSGRAQPAVAPPVVEWSSSNQGQLMAKFNWAKQGGVPTTLQVLYAQEDLWVLKNLMEIIKKTNDGATERHKAYIRKIESIQIGREASGRTGRITPVTAVAAGALGTSTEVSSAEGYGTDTTSATSTETTATTTPTGENPYGTSGGAAGPADPAENRYVDKDYKPLAATKIRSDVTASPTDVYLAVAKRMPVRLVCQIDQRKIHKLIAECGNSPLTVEVRQVRIGGNAGKGGTGGYGGGYGGYGSSYGDDTSSSFTEDSSSGSYDLSMGGYGGGYGSGGADAARALAQSMNDITVEVYGIVYIYNPVNQKALGITETQNGTGGAQPGALTADAGAGTTPR
jgi:hypothetical protein